MNPDDSVETIRWNVRRTVRQSSLSPVTRDNFHVLVCPWGVSPTVPNPLCERLRDGFRDRKRNAFTFDDLTPLFGETYPDCSRDEVARLVARTSNVVFVVYDDRVALSSPKQEAEAILSGISPDANLPNDALERVRPLIYTEDGRKKFPDGAVPGGWSRTQPALDHVETLQRRAMSIAESIRRQNLADPGSHWY